MDNRQNAPASMQPAHIIEYVKLMETNHRDMMAAMHITDPDIAFATGMIIHHQGAVDMAAIQLRHGKDRQIRLLAERIARAQQAEIRQMQQWLTKHQQGNAATSQDHSGNQKVMDMTNHDLMIQGVRSADPDVAFVKGMIPHHQDAIDMANLEIRSGKNQEMLALAQTIRMAQEPEIREMQDWLAQKGIN